MDVPRLCLPENRLLARGTRHHYNSVHRWLLKAWDPTWSQSTAPIQEFLDRHENVVPRLRLRLAQTIVNRYWDPRPSSGPPVHANNKRSKQNRKSVIMAQDWWQVYVPRRSCRVTFFSIVSARTQWYLLRRYASSSSVLTWLRDYVVALGACPLNAGMVRTYTSYVHRVVVEELQCHTTDDLQALRRNRLVVGILAVLPGKPDPQRLCRIALNRFFSEVIFRDDVWRKNLLHVNRRDLEQARRESAHPVTDQRHPALLVLAQERDHFTEAEVDAICGLAGLSLRDRLVLCILAETGLRRRAVSWLTLDALYDGVTRKARSVAHATEKGLVTRMFTLRTASLCTTMPWLWGHTRTSRTIRGDWTFPGRLSVAFPWSS